MAQGSTSTRYEMTGGRDTLMPYEAIDVLLDQRQFVLANEHHDAFVNAIDHPPAPGPKLMSLLRRTPAWRK